MSNSDVTIIIITLNDMHRDLDSFFLSLIQNNPAEIIVVDGVSYDGTIEISKKYTKSVYVINPGMSQQHIFALSKVKTKYVLVTSTNKFTPVGLLSKLKNEYQNNNCFGVHAKIKCKFETNFLEKGKKIQMMFLETNKKYNDFPTGPCLFETKKYTDFTKELNNSIQSSGFAIDTIRADFLKKKKYKILYSEKHAILHEKLSFKTYIKKIISYGEGDLFYFNKNKLHWSYYRKLLSLTHVLRRYVFYFPFKCIFIPKFYVAIPFFLMVAVFRYYGFFKALLNKNFSG